MGGAPAVSKLGNVGGVYLDVHRSTGTVQKLQVQTLTVIETADKKLNTFTAKVNNPHGRASPYVEEGRDVQIKIADNIAAGSALRATGAASDYAKAPDSTPLQVAPPLTIHVDVLLNALPSSGTPAFLKKESSEAASGSQKGWALCVDASGHLTFKWWTASGPQTTSTLLTLLTGIWYSLRVTIDASGNLTTYQNGVQQATATGVTFAASTNPLMFLTAPGGGAGAGTVSINGYVDGVQLWNVAQSQSLISFDVGGRRWDRANQVFAAFFDDAYLPLLDFSENAATITTGGSCAVAAAPANAPSLSVHTLGWFVSQGFDAKDTQATEGSLTFTGRGYETKLMWSRITGVWQNIDAAALFSQVLTTTGLDVTQNHVPSLLNVNISVMAKEHYNAYDLLWEIADTAGAIWYVDAAKDVHFLLKGSQQSGVTLDTSDAAGPGPAGAANVEFTIDDSTVENHIRGYGGKGSTQNTIQGTQTTYATVTNTTDKRVKVTVPRGEISKVEVWTKPIAGSNDNMSVRIEADNGGVSSGIPIAQVVLAPTYLQNGTWTTFTMPRNALGAGQAYWIIVSTDGTTGQQVGTDGSGNLTYRDSVAFPLIKEVKDTGSIAKYGDRAGEYRNTSIRTPDELLRLINVELVQRAWPEYTGTFEATDAKWYPVAIGQSVTCNIPSQNVANASFLVTQRQHDFEAGSYMLTMTVVQSRREIEDAQAIKVIQERIIQLEAGISDPVGIQEYGIVSEGCKLAEATLTGSLTTTGSYAIDTAQVGYSEVA